ncbi:uncharacterized protein CXQ87_002936 [Candidozyma duobushaemuli]|uniref:EH domain-containing protein n=1 Tax=Candidozyma duobushaemuli TaxID=1231522 RepID=A0A2V1AE13_9ASCO|nr:uncharacterized protein CXQ87_002936 [[Candida] duobushaemulonis]PVH15101.1 hypothetical protein CXQ87_002936 [[Candida] duobushaemulonis]
MSSAQLAASAAFRANNQKTQPPLTKITKPELKKPTPSNSPKQRSKDASPETTDPPAKKKPTEVPNLSKAAATKSSQGQLQPQQPSKKPNLQIDLSNSKNTSQASLATAAAEHSAKNQKSSVGSGSVYNTPLVRTPAAAAAVSSSEKLSQTPLPRASIDDDNVSLSSAHNDYFCIPKFYQTDNANGPGASRSRVSVVLDPKDMVENVKQSINSKAKSGSSKDVTKRNQEALSNFRQSVESKRHFSQIPQEPDVNALVLRDSSESSSPGVAPSDSEGSSPSLEHKVFNIKDLKKLNTSGLSMDSYASDSENETPITPSIAIIDADEDVQDNDTLKKPPSAPEKSSHPIPVPPSPHAVARGNAGNGTGVPEIAAQLSPSSPGNVSDLKLDEALKKVRRKPPPELIESEGSSGRQSFDQSTSNPSSGAEDDQKFPQFPDIKDKKKHRRIFGRRKGEAAQTVRERQSMDSSNEVEIDDEPEPETKPTSGISPVIANPHVALKTTMRKMKKKDKTFDENKPWKNHSKLNEVSDTERKRYEGVWVSNKGYLVNKVVTRLAGVDYNKNYTEEENARKRELSRQDPSELAAKLSSAAEPCNHETMEDHIQERHGLKSADPHELIHGIVVKRIWKRSRLPSETLEAIWNLVDFRKDGTLNKIEFLVGMWLVDQCLYGRKLPKKVEEQVWSSLGNMGLNVVIRKKRR